MTNDHATVTNDSTQRIEPVSDWENEMAKGLALCDEKNFQSRIDSIRELRACQAAYVDSLPTDRGEANRQALRILHFDGNEFPDGVKEAMHLAFAVEAMIKDGGIDEPSPTRDAALGLADMLTFALMRGTEELKRISDILGNPERSEWDGKGPQ